jgi:hypothetical protein
VLAILLAAASCGSKSVGSPGVPGKDITPVDTVAVPTEVLGLTVRAEDVHNALAAGSRTYVEATSVYSFRRSEVLQATLQISRLQDSPRYRSTEFRRALIAGLGATQAVPIRVNQDQVFVTTGNQQRLSVWFRDRYLFILGVSDNFDSPRSLLRVVVGLRT